MIHRRPYERYTDKREQKEIGYALKTIFEASMEIVVINMFLSS